MSWNHGEASRCGCGFQKLAAIHLICYLSASHRIGAAKAVCGHPSTTGHRILSLGPQEETRRHPALGLQPMQACKSRNLRRDFHDPIPADQECNPDRPESNCQPDFSRSTGSISPASDIERNPSIAARNASRSPAQNVFHPESPFSEIIYLIRESQWATLSLWTSLELAV